MPDTTPEFATNIGRVVSQGLGERVTVQDPSGGQFVTRPEVVTKARDALKRARVKEERRKVGPPVSPDYQDFVPRR